jgi:hypothetical protein
MTGLRGRLRGERAWWQTMIDRQAAWVAGWLRSRAAFVQITYGSLLWVPFVALSIDQHGFLYLYIATTLSLVTQVPLAMLAFWASRDAKAAEQKMVSALDALHAIMQGTRTLMEAAITADEQNRGMLVAIDQGGDERREILARLETMLTHSAEMAGRDIALGERLEDMLEALQVAVNGGVLVAESVQQGVVEMQKVAAESRERHLENATMIRQLLDRNRSILNAALNAASEEPRR